MFRPLVAAIATALFALVLPVMAQDAMSAPPPFHPLDAKDVGLEEFDFTQRPIVVFADRPGDADYRKQMVLLEARWPELAVRDVVIITDSDPAAQTPIRLHLRPRGFQLVLIDKQGQVALRRPFPTEVRELARTIDRMPDRRNEIRPGQFDLD